MRKKIRSFTGKKLSPGKQLAIQESMAADAKKEIYENITQCLCLARLQLASLDFSEEDKKTSVTGEVLLLLGKAISDLRDLARRL